MTLRICAASPPCCWAALLCAAAVAADSAADEASNKLAHEHLQAADRDQHERLGRQRHDRRRGHGQALPRRRLRRRGRRGARPDRQEEKRRGAPARQRQVQAGAAASGISTWSRRAARTGRRIPYKLIEKDGYFYGRGSSDMKDDDAIMATTLLRMKQEGYRPDRDIILALTADEEGGCCNGPAWLLKNHRELIDAAVRHQYRRLVGQQREGCPADVPPRRDREGLCATIS